MMIGAAIKADGAAIKTDIAASKADILSFKADQAIEAANPMSMRSAYRALSNHRLGISSEDEPSVATTHTELIKRAYEFKAVALRNQQPLTDAERAVLTDMRTVIDRLLEQGVQSDIA